MPLTPVEVLEGVSSEEIKLKMKKRTPLLIRNWNIGPCVNLWTPEYISTKVGKEAVKIHVSANRQMDFINKNFFYKTLPFDELIGRIFRARQDEYFINPEEYYYLRSLGTDPRGKDIANFLVQCQDLGEDFKIPPFYQEQDFFSSVFRASSKGLQLWTHYDVMDNILIQIRGLKRVTLWSPSEVDKMYLKGDKSRVLEIDNPDIEKYPKFIKAERFECVMSPGDMVFIPALWLHNTLALEPSLAVNIFWKNLSHDLYDKNDSYGNKDVVPGAKALNSLATATKYLNDLPTEYKQFYIRRMMMVLEENLKEL